VLSHTPFVRFSGSALIPASPLIFHVSGRRLAVSTFVTYPPAPLYVASGGCAVLHRPYFAFPRFPIQSPLFPRRRAPGDFAGALRCVVARAPPAGWITPAMPAPPAAAAC
jgi:hypothetical protein